MKLAKEALIEVLSFLQVEQGSEDKNLVNGTREYELTYNPILIKDIVVYYITSATAATRLTPVSVDWMDMYGQSDWRTTTDVGTPNKFYIDYPTSAALTTEGKIVIGLDPIPDTTTATGYPIIRIYGVEYEEPSATSDIPSGIPDIRCLVETMKRNYAMDRDPEKYLLFRKTAADSLTKAQGLINRASKGLNAPIFLGGWMSSVKVE